MSITVNPQKSIPMEMNFRRMAADIFAVESYYKRMELRLDVQWELHPWKAQEDPVLGI